MTAIRTRDAHMFKADVVIGLTVERRNSDKYVLNIRLSDGSEWPMTNETTIEGCYAAQTELANSLGWTA